jgi:hypothetical protein
MSDYRRDHKPASETAVDATFQETRCPDDAESAGTSTSAPPARLQAIYDLVHSGHYHVPAAIIADRMIERMIAEKRGKK